MAQTWWDSDFSKRQPLTVSTGAVTPDKGYQGYTARFATLDTASLVTAGELQADCDDLRLVYWNGTTNTEIPRHLIDCNTATSDLRFSIQVAQAANANDAGYYIYYNNASAGAPPAVTPTNVYLWFDDASVNRIGSYDEGRGDPWHGAGWQDSFAYNAAGYYTFNTGDNFTDSFRRPVDERDVYVEAEFFHTVCFPLNMTTGVIARGIIASGTGGSESSTHYYATNRGHNAACDGGYTQDGDIVEGSRTGIAVNGANPGAIVTNVWRRQGLATWSTNPTNLSYYDNNSATAWTALGYPNAGSLHASGTDAADSEGRGFAGVIIAQDGGRLRNMLIRRFVSPEPTTALGAVEMLGIDLVTAKALQPTTSTSMPPEGGTVTFRITVTNNSTIATASGVSLTDLLPSGLTYSSDTGGGAYNSATGVWTVGSVAAGASATLDISATVDADTAGDTITNSTTAAAGAQMDPTTTGDDLNEVIEIADPKLSVTKSHVFTTDPDSDGVGDVGDVIRYTYTVTNTGNVILTGITVTDVTNGTGDEPNDSNAPDVAHAASGSLTDNAPLGDSTDSDGSNNIWTTLGPSDVVTFTWDYTVTQSDINTLQ